MPKDFVKRKKFAEEGNQLRLGVIIGAVSILVLVSIFLEINIYKITNVILPKLISFGIGDLLMQAYYMMMVRTWVLIVLVGILAIYIPIRLSHRFLGSRYRIEKEILEHISTGNLMHEFKVREKDEMASTANALNNMLGNLRSRVRDVEDFRKDVEKDIDNCLRLIKKGLDEEKKKQVVTQLETLTEKNKKIPYLV